MKIWRIFSNHPDFVARSKQAAEFIAKNEVFRNPSRLRLNPKKVESKGQRARRLNAERVTLQALSVRRFSDYAI